MSAPRRKTAAFTLAPWAPEACWAWWMRASWTAQWPKTGRPGARRWTSRARADAARRATAAAPVQRGPGHLRAVARGAPWTRRRSRAPGRGYREALPGDRLASRRDIDLERSLAPGPAAAFSGPGGGGRGSGIPDGPVVGAH